MSAAPAPEPSHLVRLASAFLALAEEEQHAICESQRFSELGMGPALAELARDDWGLAGKNDSEKADELTTALTLAYGARAVGESAPEDLAHLLRRDSHAADRARGLLHAAREIRYRRLAKQLSRHRSLKAALHRPIRVRAPHRLRATRRVVRTRDRAKAKAAGPASSADEPGPAAQRAQPADLLPPETRLLGAAPAPGALLIHDDGGASLRARARISRAPRRAHFARPRLSCGPPKG